MNISYRYLLLTSWFALLVTAEPIQYCYKSVTEKVNFCFAASTYSNTTTQSTDLYLTLTTEHLNSSPLGWIGLGLGEEMAGSLMFIIYGDPSLSSSASVVWRTATGHHPPVSLSSLSKSNSDTENGQRVPHIRVERVTYEDFEDPNSTTAPAKMLKAQVVCYDCSSWSGKIVDLGSNTQAWIWAANTEQDFSGFPRGKDIALEYHSAHGNLWADMKSSFEVSGVASFPAMSEHTVGVSETRPTTGSASGEDQGGWIGNYILWHVHGALMATSFLLLYPLGVYLLRTSKTGEAFARHWMTQTLASGLVFIGIGIGIVQSHQISAIHQFLGLAVGFAIVMQIILGSGAHILFLNLGRHKNLTNTRTSKWRDRLASLHRTLGSAVWSFGGTNLILGAELKGYGWWGLGAVIAIVGLEKMGVFWLWWKRPKGDGDKDRIREGEDGEEGYAMLERGDEEEEVGEGATEDENRNEATQEER